MLSLVLPPLDGNIVAKDMSVTVAIVSVAVNTAAPFPLDKFDTTKFKRTILPSSTALPITPSPKYTSNFPFSTSCKKNTSDVEVNFDISVAFVKVVVVVSDNDV